MIIKYNRTKTDFRIKIFITNWCSRELV